MLRKAKEILDPFSLADITDISEWRALVPKMYEAFSGTDLPISFYDNKYDYNTQKGVKPAAKGERLVYAPIKVNVFCSLGWFLYYDPKDGNGYDIDHDISNLLWRLQNNNDPAYTSKDYKEYDDEEEEEDD